MWKWQWIRSRRQWRYAMYILAGMLAFVLQSACGPPPCLSDAECPVTGSCDVANRVCNSPGQPCREGAKRACYTGPQGTGNVGQCRGGFQTCSSGAWGACEGQVVPVPNSCDNSKDHNCDGQLDAPCVTILGSVQCEAHSGTTVAANAPGCSGRGACACKVTTTGQVYICAGTQSGAVQWALLDDVTALCTRQTIGNVVNHFCGGEKLLCDMCDGDPVFRRTTGRCLDGVLRRQ